MPQAQLPLIPEGASSINANISVVRRDGYWTYFNGIYPVFRHPENDRRSFRMFTSQLVEQQMCRVREIIKVFGVSKNSVIRNTQKYKEEGIESFYRSRRGRGPQVMQPEVVIRAQALLQKGYSWKETAKELGIHYDTLRKAIERGQVVRVRKAEEVAEKDGAGEGITNKSERSAQDAVAGMGVACTRPEERVLAAFGMLEGAPTRFERCRDVTLGGVLCALPALMENGLFQHLEQCFPTLSGYYTTLQVITLLAFMALCRIKTAEQLQYQSSGELGKLLGLDRIPEVRCLRQKLTQLSQPPEAKQWSGLLSREWMAGDVEMAGVLYVDGHVRLYHGHQTTLPRRYVSRQRLCLRGITDYWVNDSLGRPFFVVERTVNQGLLEVLRSEIVPRLLQEVPRQPTQEELEVNRYRFRFVMIFDREGYSPEFFRQMWQQHRIACITYHKYPQEAWPEEWFEETWVRLPNGEEMSIKLAEQGTWIGEAKKGIWVREVRKLAESGHQTSLISTAYDQFHLQDAAGLFSRWSQENFFRYMMQHYAIDLLNEYGTEELPGNTPRVVNPIWREWDAKMRSLKTKILHRQARFAAMTLHPEEDESRLKKWQREKAKLVEEIEQLEKEKEEVEQKRRSTPHHLHWEELPEEHQFQRLASSRKQLTDTVKMIAYRAETAMVNVVREELARVEDARSLVRELLCSEADLLPDMQAGVLQVCVHPMSNPRSNRAIQHLISCLNEAQFIYPGTNLQLVYSLVGTPIAENGST